MSPSLRRLIMTNSLPKKAVLEVASKTLIVIHRILREGDIIYRQSVLTSSERSQLLQLSNFMDNLSPIAMVRTYASYLEQRLECFRILYDVEADHLITPTPVAEKGYSKTRELGCEELLNQLPSLQLLLHRLIGCRPEEAATSNNIVQHALALVLKESFNIFCAINDGLINLVDKFFEMPRHEAIKAHEIYQKAGQQAGRLSQLYEFCRGLELTRNFHFQNLREPPQSFLAKMVEYIREAPQAVPGSTEAAASRLDLLTLGNLHDEAAYTWNQQQQHFDEAPPSNPSVTSDRFATPHQLAPSTVAEMAASFAQQQQAMMMKSNLSQPFAHALAANAPGNIEMKTFDSNQQNNPSEESEQITEAAAADPSGIEMQMFT